MTARGYTRLVIAAIHAPFGVLHVVSSHAFLKIMPPLIPFPREVVIFTGLCEIAGAVGLLLPRTRRTPRNRPRPPPSAPMRRCARRWR